MFVIKFSVILIVFVYRRMWFHIHRAYITALTYIEYYSFSFDINENSGYTFRMNSALNKWNSNIMRMVGRLKISQFFFSFLFYVCFLLILLLCVVSSIHSLRILLSIPLNNIVIDIFSPFAFLVAVFSSSSILLFFSLSFLV